MISAGEPPVAEGAGRPAARRPYCVIVENERAGRAPGTSMAPPSKFPITARETIIGRDPSCAIRLDNLFVSRRHARLLLRGATLHLDDLASTNVTRRNGDPVHTRVEVHPGDVLHFASVRCRVVEASPHPEDEIAEGEDAKPAVEEPPSEESPPEESRSEGSRSADEAGGRPGVGTHSRADAEAEPPGPAGVGPVGGDGEAAAQSRESAPPEAADSAGAEGFSSGSAGPGSLGSAAGEPGDSGGGESEPGRENGVPDREAGDETGYEAVEEPPAPPRAAAASPVPSGGDAPTASPEVGDFPPAPPIVPVPPATSPDARPGPIFVAGPLAGEPRRTRVRAALWLLALLALSALAAVVFL